MVTPDAGNGQVTVKPLLPLRTITGAAHWSVTEPLPTSDLIIFSLTAIALIVTPLTFSVRGTVYAVLEVVGGLPSMV